MATTAKPKRKNEFKDLFFIRRFPKGNIPPNWQRPATEEEYRKALEYEDFITVHFDPGNVDKLPVIVQDLKDLDQHLMQSFFEFSQKSKYFQDQFYLYQWVFVLGAFITTALGVFSTYIFSANNEIATIGFQAATLVTAAVGALTAYFTSESNRKQPQKYWGKTRRLAEELRMTYFKYLSHLPPYDKPDRLKILRENVLNIRAQERENV
jgi:hypothetical protein